MAWGRPLYNTEATIWETGLNDKNGVMVLVKEEFGTMMDIEVDLSNKHKSKIEQVKSMFPEYDDNFVSYVLSKKKEDVNNTILTFTSPDEKERFFNQYSELQVQKMAARPGVFGNGSDGNGNSGERVNTLKTTISNYKLLYNTLVGLMDIKNSDLSKKIFGILRSLPPSEDLKGDIISEFFEEKYGGFNFGGNSNVEDTITTKPISNMGFYYFEILGKVLMDLLKEKDQAKITEFFMNESALKIINTFLYNCEETFENFYSICRKEELTTKSRKETETIEQIYYVVPILGVIHSIFDLALDSQIVNSKSTKIELSNERLSFLNFKNELENSNNYDENDESYNMEMISDIAKSIIMNEALLNRLMEMYMIILRCLWLNSYNFAGNGNIIGILFNIFGLLEKRALILHNQGDSDESKFMYVDKIIEFFLKISTLKSNNLLGNLLLIHLNCFRTRIPKIYKKLMEVVIENGYFTHIPNNVYQVLKVLGEHKALMDQKTLKSVLFNRQMGKELVDVYFDYLEKLPKFDQLNKENYEKLLPDNFEGVLETMNMLLESIKNLNFEVENSKIDKLYTELAKDNLKLLFSEEESIFHSCLSKGENSLKYNFFQVCLTLCKLNNEYSLEILKFLSTVYTKKDFEMSSYQYVGLRGGQEYIGLKNLGCTCYANSLFQQFYHNPTIRNGIMGSEVDSHDMNQTILYQVKNVFWRLKHSKMSYTFLDKFCGVFTGFDGMPINVRIQQDVNEFFNLLVDNLERQIKESNNKRQEQEKSHQLDPFIQEFGGQFVNIIQSIEDEYEYKRERPENFLSVPLTVKNMININDALDEFCSEEYFKDDNKLHIEEYDKKIAVSKKYMFKKLPRTLIFNLKRFEYNMQTFQRYKLNDFFEFPMNVDLKKWCKFDGEDDQNQETNYELKGVLIHSGSAQAGHYYSYIKKGDEWLEFNDTNVRTFSPEIQNLHKEWFGQGKTDVNDVDFVSMNMGGNTCAYMLFYHRVDCFDAEEHVLDENEDFKQNMNEVEEENKAFVRQKIFVDNVSLKFLDNLLNVMDKEDIINEVEKMLLEKVDKVIEEGEKTEEKEGEEGAMVEETEEDNKEETKVEGEGDKVMEEEETKEDNKEEAKGEEREEDKAMVEETPEETKEEVKEEPQEDDNKAMVEETKEEPKVEVEGMVEETTPETAQESKPENPEETSEAKETPETKNDDILEGDENILEEIAEAAKKDEQEEESEPDYDIKILNQGLLDILSSKNVSNYLLTLGYNPPQTGFQARSS